MSSHLQQPKGSHSSQVPRADFGKMALSLVLPHLSVQQACIGLKQRHTYSVKCTIRNSIINREWCTPTISLKRAKNQSCVTGIPIKSPFRNRNSIPLRPARVNQAVNAGVGRGTESGVYSPSSPTRVRLDASSIVLPSYILAIRLRKKFTRLHAERI